MPTPSENITAKTGVHLFFRAAAVCIDAFVIHLLLTIPANFLYFPWGNEGRDLWIFLFLICIIAWILPSFLDSRMGSGTIGKRFLHLQVVDCKGCPVSIFVSLLRNLIKVLSVAGIFYAVKEGVTAWVQFPDYTLSLERAFHLLGITVVLFPLFSPGRLALHDFICRTRVVEVIPKKQPETQSACTEKRA